MEENFDPTTAKQNDEPSHGRDGNHLDVKDSKAEVLILADRLELKDLFKSGVEYFRSKLENHTAGQMLTVAQPTKMLPSLPKNQRCWRSLSLIRRKSCLLCGSSYSSPSQNLRQSQHTYYRRRGLELLLRGIACHL